MFFFGGVARGLVEVLVLFEVWQHVLESPAFVTQVRPIIIVGRLAPVVHLGIDRTSTTEPFTSRLLDGFAIHAFLRNN